MGIFRRKKILDLSDLGVDIRGETAYCSGSSIFLYNEGNSDKLIEISTVTGQGHRFYAKGDAITLRKIIYNVFSAGAGKPLIVVKEVEARICEGRK